jgi:hypothetical protein
MEGCFLTKCSVRDWLAAKNATSVVCERPIRDKTYVLIYSATICGSFAFLAVVMRVFVALRQNSFGYDDLCACLASCMAVPNFIGLTISAKQGLGRDMWTLTPEEIQRCLRVSYDGWLLSGEGLRLTSDPANLRLPKLLLLVLWIHKADLLVLLSAHISVRKHEDVVFHWYCNIVRIRCRLWSPYDVCLLAYTRYVHVEPTPSCSRTYI